MGRRTPIAELKEISENYDLFANTKWLHRGLDYIFEGRAWTNDGGAGVGQRSVKTSDYWQGAAFNQLGNVVDGSFASPATIGGVTNYSIALYTKSCFNYMVIRTKLPTNVWVPGLWGQSLYFGFEDDYQGGSGFYFEYYCDAANTPFLGMTAVSMLNPVTRVDLNGLLGAGWPANFRTNIHTYALAVLKNSAEFYIDGVLRGIFLQSTDLAFTTVAGPPYSIARYPRPIATKQSGLLENANLGVAMTWPLNPSDARFINTEVSPSRVFRLYRAGTSTLFAGYTIPAPGPTTEISHPFPILGYTFKTPHFQATTGGTLQIQVLEQTNNWRNYGDPISVVANTLAPPTMIGSGVLARLAFTPSAYPSTISDAEVVMS